MVISLGLCLVLMPIKPAISITQPKPSDSLHIPYFDQKIWQLDSLGCLDKRADFSETLLLNKDGMIGKRRVFIEALLGVPNRWSYDKKNAYYYMTSGIQCQENYYRNGNLVEVLTLCLTYKGDTLTDLIVFFP
ncbi:hypothetical protein CLV59_103292 [Chitinophaga dinghuensis]|uniref:Uncharacterized protein n=1 Tax=Chitinophaga dinghuensis TaxID=1539050 RepID=A0A327WB58_9BACT|nr:hypothetical protein [Chitinophaga dinghuensis]RAJ83328.1 hypothetical protein CLV59_103292 [Chitinophaga dinghuensis]